MSKLYSLAVIIFFCTLLTGCEKESKTNWTGVYKTAATLQLDAPKMYTKNGVITNVQTIKDYLTRDTFPFFGSRDIGFVFDRSTQPLTSPF